MRKMHDPKEYQQLRFHPYNIALTLLLFSITALFLAFSAAYLYTRVQNPEIPTVTLPKIFILNTLILVGSSYSINWATQCYLNDDTENYTRALQVTIVLTVIFMILQSIGWNQLMGQMESHFLASNLSSYLYLISGLHFAHIVAGLPFLLLFLYAAHK